MDRTEGGNLFLTFANNSNDFFSDGDRDEDVASADAYFRAPEIVARAKGVVAVVIAAINELEQVADGGPHFSCQEGLRCQLPALTHPSLSAGAGCSSLQYQKGNCEYDKDKR